MDPREVLIGVLILFCAVAPAAAELTVVSTTTVLWEPIEFIGGDHVEAIYIADPTICPHMQGEIIPNRIQMEKEFIRDANLFVCHNFTVDNPHVIPVVEEYMLANDYGEIAWVELEDPQRTWNTPENAILLAEEVEGWLSDADPANAAYYEERLADYIALIEAADVTAEEEARIAGQDVIVIVWQRNAAEQWLGLNVVSIFAPEFYQKGQFTAKKCVDDIYADPGKYAEVRYVIENMQSGELGKGIEEALHDNGIDAQRVIFTNFPKSVPEANTIPEVLEYNKHLVMAEEPADTGAAATTGEAQAPLGVVSALLALLAVVVYAARPR